MLFILEISWFSEQVPIRINVNPNPAHNPFINSGAKLNWFVTKKIT